MAAKASLHTLLTSVPLDEDPVAAVQTVIDRIWRKKAAKYGRRVHETAGVTLDPPAGRRGLGLVRVEDGDGRSPVAT